MSNPDGDNNSQSATPAQQNMIPKERLDELIADKRRIEQENQILQQVLRSQVPPQQQAQPAQEDPRLRKLREENPEMHSLFVQAIQKGQQANATAFMNWDKLDRMEFKQEFGEEGMQKLQDVEALLQQYRAQGHAGVTRQQVFIHMKGVDAVKAKSAPQTQVQPVVPQAPVNQNVPSQDPASAGTSVGGSAAANQVPRTLEQMEKDLENAII